MPTKDEILEHYLLISKTFYPFKRHQWFKCSTEKSHDIICHCGFEFEQDCSLFGFFLFSNCITNELEIRDHLQQFHPKEYEIYFHSDSVNEQELLAERADLDKKRIKAWWISL